MEVDEESEEAIDIKQTPGQQKLTPDVKDAWETAQDDSQPWATWITGFGCMKAHGQACMQVWGE